jgi:hypothetical protein
LFWSDLGRFLILLQNREMQTFIGRVPAVEMLMGTVIMLLFVIEADYVGLRSFLVK